MIPILTLAYEDLLADAIEADWKRPPAPDPTGLVAVFLQVAAAGRDAAETMSVLVMSATGRTADVVYARRMHLEHHAALAKDRRALANGIRGCRFSGHINARMGQYGLVR